MDSERKREPGDLLPTQSGAGGASDPAAGRWAGAREVMLMSWPIVLGSMSFTIMEFMDKWMVSRLGTAPLAAVGSAGLWSHTMSTFILGVVACVSTFVAQCVGRGEPQHCARYTWQALHLSWAAGALALVLWPLSGALFGCMQHSETVTALELVYFRIRLLGYIPLVWATALAVFFQAVNRSPIPMYAALVTNTLNVVLNYLLIFGAFGFPRLGIAGAAWATVIAQFVQAGLLFTIFLSPPFHRAYETRRAWAYSRRRAGELLRIGAPGGLVAFMDIATWGIFVSFIVGRFGDVQLAANNVAVSFMQISFMPVVALNQGIAPIVAQWIGRGNASLAKARTYTTLRIAAVYMVAMGLIFAVFGGHFIRLIFSQDTEVIRLGHTFLILAAVFQGFDAVNIVCAGALRGAGDTRWMMWITLLFAWGMFLPLAVGLAFVLGGGAIGAWFGATIYIIGLSGVLFRRFRGERWRHIHIFRADV